MFNTKTILIKSTQKINSYALPHRHFCSSSNPTRGFRVLGLQQIAIGGVNKEDLSYFWGDLLGLTKVSQYKSVNENVDEDIYNMGYGNSVIEIDLMQPIDSEKSPKVHIPPLNHIGLWVDHLPNAVTYLTSKGVKMAPGGIRKGAAGYDITFIHPKSACGVLIELVQAPEHIIEAYNKGTTNK